MESMIYFLYFFNFSELLEEAKQRQIEERRKLLLSSMTTTEQESNDIMSITQLKSFAYKLRKKEKSK